jgi:ferritin-like protein
MDLTRGDFLRLGAAGATVAAGGALGASAAFGAPQPPKPIGDDVGFLTFGVVAERTSLTFYKEALTTPKLFDAGDRRRLTWGRDAKREHVQRLNEALGADAVSSDDYQVTFPKQSFASRRNAVGLGVALEKLLVGVYVYGVSATADPGSRLLIGRLLSVDNQALSTLRAMNGKASIGGLPSPLDTDQAGDVLDKLLTIPGSPGGG